MKTVLCILICTLLFSSCFAPDTSRDIMNNADASFNMESSNIQSEVPTDSDIIHNDSKIDISLAQDAELDSDIINYVMARVYGLSRAGTYYEFDGIEGLNLESLRLYLTEAANVKWHPFLEPIFVEQEKWMKGKYLSYADIMKILSEELEITKFPFVVNKPEEIFLNISPTELTGGNSGEKITVQETEEYIVVNCRSTQCYDWFQPKMIAENEGEFFFKDTDLNAGNSPYVSKDINYIFKKRDKRLPMLIKGKFTSSL